MGNSTTLSNEGICGMSLFQSLTVTHGQNFVRAFTLEQAKLYVDSKVPSYKQKFQEYYKTYEQKKLLEIDEKVSVINNFIEEKKNFIKEQYSSLIKINLPGQNEQLDELIKQFTNPIQVKKNQVKALITSNNKEVILTEMTNQHQRIINELQFQKPLVRLYVDLDPEIRKQIDLRAVQFYKKQIQQQNEIVATQLEKSIGVARMEEILIKYDPVADLDKEIANTKVFLNQETEKLIATIQNSSNLKAEFKGFAKSGQSPQH